MLGPAWKKIAGDREETITFTEKSKSFIIVQFQGAFWRKPNNPNGNKEVYVSKEVKENALAREGKSCRPNNCRRKSICVSRPISMKQGSKIIFALPQSKHRTIQSIIAREKYNCESSFDMTACQALVQS